MPLVDHEFDLQNQENGDQRHACKSDEKSDNAFGQRKLILRKILRAIVIPRLVALEDFSEQAVVRLGLEERVRQEGDKQNDGNSARDFERFAYNVVLSEIASAPEGVGKNGGKNQTHCAR